MMIISNVARAELVLRTLGEMSELTYDEALLLVKDAEQFISNMGPLDPAAMYFYNQRQSLYRLMEAKNIIQNLNREEHLQTVSLMATSYLGQDDEFTVKVPKRLNLKSTASLDYIRGYINTIYVQQGLTKFQVNDLIKEMVVID